MSSGKNEQPNEAEKNIEIWKVKKLIKRLEAARGNGTSMISLIIRPCSLRQRERERKSDRLTICSAQGSSVARRQDVG
jgi:peptide subunit release factor 1 (eRF1)